MHYVVEEPLQIIEILYQLNDILLITILTFHIMCTMLINIRLMTMFRKCGQYFDTTSIKKALNIFNLGGRYVIFTI